jgi:probable F420-dependent oxidoreductase
MLLGVKVNPALTRDDLLRDSRYAEDIGFHSVWLSERVAIPLDKPHPYAPMIDPWVGLAFVAAITERVILSTSVSQIALRPPVLMARELATIDRLSNGRLIVGAGAGWVQEEFTTTNVDFDTRGGRLNEFIPLLRHLWTKPHEAWNGRHFKIPAAGILSPLTPGGPKIYIGASGPAGLKRVARLGDGYISVGMKPDMLANVKASLLGLRESFGRTGPFPVWAQVTPPESLDEAERLVAEYADAGADGLVLATPLADETGFPKDEVITLRLLELAQKAP